MILLTIRIYIFIEVAIIVRKFYVKLKLSFFLKTILIYFQSDLEETKNIRTHKSELNYLFRKPNEYFHYVKFNIAVLQR